MKSFVDPKPSEGAKDIIELGGKYADDPCLQEICEEAYRQRNLEMKAQIDYIDSINNLSSENK